MTGEAGITRNVDQFMKRSDLRNTKLDSYDPQAVDDIIREQKRLILAGSRREAGKEKDWLLSDEAAINSQLAGNPQARFEMSEDKMTYKSTVDQNELNAIRTASEQREARANELKSRLEKLDAETAKHEKRADSLKKRLSDLSAELVRYQNELSVDPNLDSWLQARSASLDSNVPDRIQEISKEREAIEMELSVLDQASKLISSSRDADTEYFMSLKSSFIELKDLAEKMARLDEERKRLLEKKELAERNKKAQLTRAENILSSVDELNRMQELRKQLGTLRAQLELGINAEVVEKQKRMAQLAINNADKHAERLQQISNELSSLESQTSNLLNDFNRVNKLIGEKREGHFSAKALGEQSAFQVGVKPVDQEDIQSSPNTVPDVDVEEAVAPSPLPEAVAVMDQLIREGSTTASSNGGDLTNENSGAEPSIQEDTLPSGSVLETDTNVTSGEAATPDEASVVSSNEGESLPPVGLEPSEVPDESPEVVTDLPEPDQEQQPLIEATEQPLPQTPNIESESQEKARILSKLLSVFDRNDRSTNITADLRSLLGREPSLDELRMLNDAAGKSENIIINQTFKEFASKQLESIIARERPALDRESGLDDRTRARIREIDDEINQLKQKDHPIFFQTNGLRRDVAGSEIENRIFTLQEEREDLITGKRKVDRPGLLRRALGGLGGIGRGLGRGISGIGSSLAEADRALLEENARKKLDNEVQARVDELVQPIADQIYRLKSKYTTPESRNTSEFKTELASLYSMMYNRITGQQDGRYYRDLVRMIDVPDANLNLQTLDINMSGDRNIAESNRQDILRQVFRGLMSQAGITRETITDPYVRDRVFGSGLL